MIKKLRLILLFVVAGKSATAQVNIIPRPAEVILPAQQGWFTITNTTRIVIANEVKPSANFLNAYLHQYYGLTLKSGKSANANSIQFSIDKEAGAAPGAYTMEINDKGVRIKGYDAAGVFYGLQSLLQLLPPEKTAALQIQYLSIKDTPRFQYRGMHLDVGRHFFPLSFIKKYIDYLAFHKMNYFHWHLTEDQGWRIEIKKYPRLTQTGGYRNGTIIGRFPGTGNDNLRYGGYYTQKEVKEIVAYAAKSYITVIPEIELPGHSSAAIAAYPELSCFPGENTKFPRRTVWAGDSTGKQVQQTWGVFNDVFCPSEKTFSFLEDVFDEVLALFPSKYIHIGGDECPKENWKRSELCQQLIKEHNLKDEHGLQSYFIQRIEKYLNKKGRTIIGWDEILEGGLAPNAIVMSWRGEKGGIEAAKQDHYVIMTPGSHVYLDHSQTGKEDSVTIGGHTTVQKVYSYEPVPQEIPSGKEKYVLGAQGNVWTEYIRYPSKVEYHIFPRMSALSEVLWSPKELRSWENFEPRLQAQFKRYDCWQANYSKAYFDPQSTVPPQPKRRN